MNQAIENNFKYHAPSGEQPQKYIDLRAKGKELAYLIDQLCPNSREKSIALTNLEQAIMWANASVARNEQELKQTTKDTIAAILKNYMPPEEMK